MCAAVAKDNAKKLRMD